METIDITVKSNSQLDDIIRADTPEAVAALDRLQADIDAPEDPERWDGLS